MNTKLAPIRTREPYRDEHSFDAIDEAIHQLAESRGVWLDDAGLIHILASLISHAEACLPETITDARADDDTSWEDLARLLGTSPDHAKARYDQASATADTRTAHNY